MRLLLWLVYLLADSTAIYALGHLSVTSSTSRGHQLVAFWAPFLLVHLGGPDSITAYALEDSRLWLRHLLTLVVQALAAAYVLYRYIAGSETLLLRAAIMMFIVGVLKYGERTWALKHGSMGRLQSECRRLGFVSEFAMPDGLADRTDNEEEVLVAAYMMFPICIHLFGGTIIGPEDSCKWLHAYGLGGEDLHKLVEMELSLMYDTLYTKAAVIHTWYGCCIRIISLALTIAALMLFKFSNKLGYSRADVAITYVLVIGALIVEIISVSGTLGSSWMCMLLRVMFLTPLLDLLKSLRRRVHATRKRRWSGSIGQYNLFHLCTHDQTDLGSRLAKMVGLEDWWSRLHFSGTADISETDLKDLLCKTLPDIDSRNSRGAHILENRGLSEDRAEWSHWSVKIDLDRSILIWHIATDIYLCKSKVKHGEKLAEAVKVLSNYMMFLLVAKPALLPGLIRHALYSQTRKNLHMKWRTNSFDVLPWNLRPPNAVSPKKSWRCMLKELFHHEGPNDSCRIIQQQELARSILKGEVYTDISLI
ncbi:uncharacterized protein [Aegilops tauschii subsp. strangulata]|uniref:uncharacterized protein n=1 Tax=Aegilops tauschii subsp. strangulata TaxID=200361 RepID=UPI001E1CAEED|nr:uncharacterized protein LOC123495134 [Aegilops tauschii subsp. strangulata]